MAHFLKRLELNGFKSFAGRTVLEFPDGITAIVGPNGSGKSNIVDAIRWLLGERDAKSLRGAKVEDLIFAGTPKRARVGQAQASLHFENIGNFFPVESSEVSIMRQVNRDGQSQYFLNKSEILLRDLVGFYAKARLGSKGLIVVTQGNSDMFIQATPVARREMIEEMLGLREYQIKKSDGQRRLKTSRINLDKARSLAEEILPHLRSLKRQTGRFEKRADVEEELANLERAYYGSQTKKIVADMARVKRDIEEKALARKTLEEKKTRAQEAQAAVEASEPEARSQLRDIKTKIQQLFSERSRIEKEAARLEAKIEAQMEMREKKKETANLPSHTELLSLVRRIKDALRGALEAEHGVLKSTVADAISHIDKAFVKKEESGAGESESDLNGIRESFARLSDHLAVLDRDIQSFQSQEQDLEKGQEQFTTAFKEAVAAVDAVRREIDTWEEGNRARVFEKERLEMHWEELTRTLAQVGKTPEEFAHAEIDASVAIDEATAQNRIFRLRAELAAIGDIDEALVAEARETEERYQFLVREAADLERATEDLKKLVEDLREKIQGEFHGALEKINKEFEAFFVAMFGGGVAKLKPTVPAEKKTAEDSVADGEKDEAAEEEKEYEEGLEISVSLPRKRIASLEALSGGERSLVGIAALFALISVSPPPFLVLDEVDAPLDEKNARRFAEMLRAFSRKTQFILVTHNRATMESADVLYGVTLDADGTSKVLSLKFEESTMHAR